VLVTALLISGSEVRAFHQNSKRIAAGSNDYWACRSLFVTKLVPLFLAMLPFSV
jgi:hypothetical protein